MSLWKRGAGKLTLSGDNISYTGGTTIYNGALVLENVMNTGFNATNIVVDGTLEFAATEESPTFNGNISGVGNVVKSGSHNLALGRQ